MESEGSLSCPQEPAICPCHSEPITVIYINIKISEVCKFVNTYTENTGLRTIITFLNIIVFLKVTEDYT
jgi:hypothetical protein